MRYATPFNWEKYFEEYEDIHIGYQTIHIRLQRLEKVEIIIARGRVGALFKNYSETDVREACADLLKRVTKVDENGVLEIDGQKYRSIGSWSKFFMEREGIVITYITIKKKLKQAGKIGVTGEDGKGHIHEKAFFSEADVRNVCEDKLKKLPQADKNGFFELEGEKYGSSKAWSQYFKEDEGVKISANSIVYDFKKAGKVGLVGKDLHGCVRKNTYFSESDVREVCKDKIAKLPQVDDTGFFEIRGEKYGSTAAWSKYFLNKEGTQIGGDSIRRRMKNDKRMGITAKASSGQIFENAFFSESDVREVCKDRLIKFPQVNDDGFFNQNGELFASLFTWAEHFKKENGIFTSRYVLRKRLREVGAIGITAIAANGQLREKGYFSKANVRFACADLLEKKSNPKAA